MKQVLAVFIDGLKYTSLSHMPFVSSFSSKKKLKTILGYSITCHASMYSGLYTDRHLMWFLWKYGPESSPFRWIPDSRFVDIVNSLPSRYFLGKMTRLFSDSTSYGGVSVMKKSALKNWKYFDTAEKKLWDEVGYLEDSKTIFDFLRDNNKTIDSVGLTDIKNEGGSIKHVEAYTVPDEPSDVTYLFIGDVDHVSHVHSQESPECVDVIKRIDREVERVYSEIKDRTGEAPELVCWSDHGHMKIDEQYDIYEHFSTRGTELDDLIHIIDANFARFWFRDDRERELVTRLLTDMPSGFIMTDDDLEKYRTKMPDRRYGDLIYYLEHPYMFKKTVWGYGLRTRSIHGFLPEHTETEGVFVSNLKVAKKDHVELVDIVPSLLDLLKIDSEVDFDGQSLWE